MKVSLMITCLGDCIRPEAGIAAVKLLRRLGCEVEFPAAQTCCGQPMFNSGYKELAKRQAMHTIEVFSKDEPVVVPSGSCAAMVKVEFLHLFEHGDPWHARAEELAARTYELTDFLVNRLQVTDVGAKFEGRVAHHFACHLRGLGQSGQVEKLLSRVGGATVVELPRQDQCCGFGGSFAVRYPDISGAMVSDKCRCILNCGADCVVSTDAGCLMNIGGRLRRMQRDGAAEREVRVLHVAELLATM